MWIHFLVHSDCMYNVDVSDVLILMCLFLGALISDLKWVFMWMSWMSVCAWLLTQLTVVSWLLTLLCFGVCTVQTDRDADHTAFILSVHMLRCVHLDDDMDFCLLFETELGQHSYSKSGVFKKLLQRQSQENLIIVFGNNNNFIIIFFETGLKVLYLFRVGVSDRCNSLLPEFPLSAWLFFRLWKFTIEVNRLSDISR